MLNICVLAGNLGSVPEIHFAPSGEQIASFNLAFRSGKKTGWIKVTCFQKLSSLVEAHLHKGARVAVTGSLDHHQWETSEGVKRSAIQMIANQIEFIKTDGRGFKDGDNQADETPF